MREGSWRQRVHSRAVPLCFGDLMSSSRYHFTVTSKNIRKHTNDATDSKPFGFIDYHRMLLVPMENTQAAGRFR